MHTNTGMHRYRYSKIATYTTTDTQTEVYRKAHLCRYSSEHTDLPTIEIIEDSHTESSTERQRGTRQEVINRHE